MESLSSQTTPLLNLGFLSEMVMTFALNVVGELILVLGYATYSVTHLEKLTNPGLNYRNSKGKKGQGRGFLVLF